MSHIYSFIIVTFSINISIECSFNLQLRRISYAVFFSCASKTKTVDGSHVFAVWCMFCYMNCQHNSQWSNLQMSFFPLIFDIVAIVVVVFKSIQSQFILEQFIMLANSKEKNYILPFVLCVLLHFEIKMHSGSHHRQETCSFICT